jgi:hypothetical protein
MKKRSVRSREVSAARDGVIRRRLASALDGSEPLACTAHEVETLARWAGLTATADGTPARVRARVAAKFVLAKLFGVKYEAFGFRGFDKAPQRRSVAVLEEGIAAAYDVVRVGQQAIELRPVNMLDRKLPSRLFHLNGAAIDNHEHRIAPADLARIRMRREDDYDGPWIGDRVRLRGGVLEGLVVGIGSFAGRNDASVKWESGVYTSYESEAFAKQCEVIASPYTETGHDMAAKEAERLRAQVASLQEQIESSGRSHLVQVNNLRSALAEAERDLIATRKERDESRAELERLRRGINDLKTRLAS